MWEENTRCGVLERVNIDEGERREEKFSFLQANYSLALGFGNARITGGQHACIETRAATVMHTYVQYRHEFLGAHAQMLE